MRYFFTVIVVVTIAAIAAPAGLLDRVESLVAGRSVDADEPDPRSLAEDALRSIPGRVLASLALPDRLDPARGPRLSETLVLPKSAKAAPYTALSARPAKAPAILVASLQDPASLDGETRGETDGAPAAEPAPMWMAALPPVADAMHEESSDWLSDLSPAAPRELMTPEQDPNRESPDGEFLPETPPALDARRDRAERPATDDAPLTARKVAPTIAQEPSLAETAARLVAGLGALAAPSEGPDPAAETSAPEISAPEISAPEISAAETFAAETATRAVMADIAGLVDGDRDRDVAERNAIGEAVMAALFSLPPLMTGAGPDHPLDPAAAASIDLDAIPDPAPEDPRATIEKVTAPASGEAKAQVASRAAGSHEFPDGPQAGPHPTDPEPEAAPAHPFVDATLATAPLPQTAAEGLPRDGAVFVVIGSYIEARHAERVKREHAGWKASVRPAEVDGKKRLRVVVGPFGPDEWSEALSRIRATDAPDAWPLPAPAGPDALALSSLGLPG